MSRIRRRPRAEEDLLEIWSYIAREDAGAADRLLDRILTKLELVALHPFSGRERPELAEALRSVPLGNYVLFYRAVGDGIELVRVRSRYVDLNADSFDA